MFARYIQGRDFASLAGIAAFALAGAMATAAAAPEKQADRPIVLEASPMTGGDVFECRVPIDLRYEGEPELSQFQIIAKVYAGDRERASSGITSDDGTVLRKRVEGGWSYEAVPVQFDLTDELCVTMDGLRIEYASCVFGEHSAEDCLAKIRFASVPADDPLFMSLE